MKSFENYPLQIRLVKVTVETTNQKNHLAKKEKDYQVNIRKKIYYIWILVICNQNSLHTVYNDIVYCTECLSHDSEEPFIIDSPTSSYDEIETWLSKVKVTFNILSKKKINN